MDAAGMTEAFGFHKLTSYHLSTANEPARFLIGRFLFLVLKHIPQIIRSFS